MKSGGGFDLPDDMDQAYEYQWVSYDPHTKYASARLRQDDLLRRGWVPILPAHAPGLPVKGEFVMHGGLTLFERDKRLSNRLKETGYD